MVSHCSILFDGHKHTRFINITMAKDLSYEENVPPSVGRDVYMYAFLFNIGKRLKVAALLWMK